MSAPEQQVAGVLATSLGIPSTEIEVNSKPADAGTLVFAVRASEAGAPETADELRERWFGARVYFVSDEGEVFWLPSSAASAARATKFLADPDRRAKARVEA